MQRNLSELICEHITQDMNEYKFIYFYNVVWKGSEPLREDCKVMK